MDEFPPDGFTLKSREQVIQFEALADSYSRNKILIPLKHLSLVNAYDYCQTRTDGNKLFPSILDIYINFILLWKDHMSIYQVWGDGSDGGALDSGSVLDSEAKFFRKMELHNCYSVFVFRYRALWDKLMGAVVLYFFPDKYEDFSRAKSRRRAFKKIILASNLPFNEFISFLDSHLDNFDNSYRTAEAHGTGTLRKRSFDAQPIEKSLFLELTQPWNVMVLFMVAFGKLFPDISKNTNRDAPK